MKENDKIMFLMPSLFVGGSELQVRYIIDGLESAGKKIVVLVENGSVTDDENTEYVNKHNKVKFVFLGQNTYEKENKNRKNKLKSLSCIIKWLLLNTKKENIKWAMFTNYTGLLTVPICRLMGIKVLFNERNPGRKMCDSAIKRACLKLSTKIVANSHSAAEYMSKVLNRKVEVVNNGVVVNTLWKEKADFNENLNILIPARVTRIKNQIVAAKALAILDGQGIKNIEITCAGKIEETDYVDEIKSFVKANGIESRFNFIGYVSNIDDYYTVCDIVLLPSYEEGTPNVLLEAYSRKRLCIASNIEMNKDITTEKHLLFFPDNPQELVDVIKWIVSSGFDVRKRIIRDNYSYVNKNYSLEAMQKRYLEIFNG